MIVRPLQIRCEADAFCCFSQTVDSWDGVASAMVVKDVKEINAVRSACSIADVVFKKFMITKVSEWPMRCRAQSTNRVVTA